MVTSRTIVVSTIQLTRQLASLFMSSISEHPLPIKGLPSLIHRALNWSLQGNNFLSKATERVSGILLCAPLLCLILPGASVTMMMMKSLLTVLFSLALVVAKDHGDANDMDQVNGADISYDKDRFGSDLFGQPIRLDGGSSPETCQLLCSSRRTCKSWSYDTCSRRSCWLKYRFPPLSPNNCRVTL